MMVIRSAKLDDVARLSAVMGTVIQETGAYLEPRGPDYTRLAVQLQAVSAGQRIHLLAEYCGEIMGWVEVAPYPATTMRHAANLAIGVAAPYRGRGVGSALLQQALKNSFAAGLRVIHLEVEAGNKAALGLYARCGFKIDGIRRMAKLCPKTGTYVDLVLMTCLK